MEQARPAGGRSTLLRVLFERDHRQCSLLVSIAVLALPALLMGLAGGAGFQTVELFFVGRLGPAGTAAFGVASQAFVLAFAVCLAVACIGQFPDVLLRLLSHDADVIEAGTGFVRVAYGFMFAQMIASLAAALFVALPVAWILTTRTELGPRALWIANLAFSRTNIALATGWLALGRWARPSGA